MFKTEVMEAGKVEDAGFMRFNGGTHLAVDVPDGMSTISAKLSDGRKIVMSFVPYEAGGVPNCVDIADDREEMKIIAFSGGGEKDPYSSARDGGEVKIVAVLLENGKKEE